MRIGEFSGCHQMPKRSFFIHGYQFPVCARCTGLLVGNILSILLIPVIQPKAVAVILLLPLALDGLTQLANWRESTNWLRFLTGVLGGYGLYTAFLSLLILIL
ncbi:DUF2085 domain-containing protein [Neobittarella massiliensis]|uniref:DUF2085 domain-containing protein n=2 Tax=Neobittarella massiliensis (ex Bilen et al. 2018) TaxID=2041842 RepID=A0A8J6M255_9FIRM|nr:DUF2085 domain-containing protein [Neobittarella massiliensis]